MRLQCLTNVVHLSMASQGGRPGAKFAQAAMFITRKNADSVFLMLCTAKNKQGMKYNVKNNIKQLFTRCINQGMATVRLIEPCIDIYIKKADCNQLKRLLYALKLAHGGDSLKGNSILASSAPVKNKTFEKMKTKMTIARKEDYPITTSFPAKLEKLEVHNCRLSKVDSRMTRLDMLTVLNLQGNCIKTLPQCLCDMKMLYELNVSENKLTEVPAYLCSARSNLCSTLRFLHLDKNQLCKLPNNIFMLKNLFTLSASHNTLKSLPPGIGLLKSLKIINFSHNSLSYLPNSFSSFNLQSLDLYNNCFASSNNPSWPISSESNVTSLKELSANVIKKHKIFYDNYKYVPYVLICYLHGGVRCCRCMNFCFKSTWRFLNQFDLSQISESTVSVNSFGSTVVTIQNHFCSFRCVSSIPRLM